MGIKAKETKVSVGDKELIVKEMVLSQRDFLFEKLREYRISEMLYSNKYGKQLLGSVVADGGGQITAPMILDAIQEIIVKLGSKDLTDLIVRILNIEQNKKIVGETIIESWIRNNMTWTQEPNVLKAIFEVNDIEGILKNYLEIGQTLGKLFQSRKPSPESQEKSESTPK